MKIVIDTKTGIATQEEYTPPKKSKAQEKADRINEIHEQLAELDDIIKRPLEDVIERMHKEFGYVPYTTTIDVINQKEDLRDELEQLTKK